MISLVSKWPFCTWQNLEQLWHFEYFQVSVKIRDRSTVAAHLWQSLIPGPRWKLILLLSQQIRPAQHVRAPVTWKVTSSPQQNTVPPSMPPGNSFWVSRTLTSLVLRILTILSGHPSRRTLPAISCPPSMTSSVRDLEKSKQIIFQSNHLRSCPFTIGSSDSSSSSKGLFNTSSSSKELFICSRDLFSNDSNKLLLSNSSSSKDLTNNYLSRKSSRVSNNSNSNCPNLSRSSSYRRWYSSRSFLLGPRQLKRETTQKEMLLWKPKR